MINVTFKLKSAKKTASGVLVQLAGDDGFEWRLADQPHPQQPAGCVTIWHWCSSSYRWIDEGAVDKLLKPDLSDVLALDVNKPVLDEFFTGIASCDFYDGLSHQLYLDLDDMTLSINTEASDNSWLQRDDGSLIQIYRVSGYCDTPEEERYNTERGDWLPDFGYQEWLDELAQRIPEAVSGR